MTPETLPKLDFIRANVQLFQRCGSVVASYRTRNGRRFGPYYRLAYQQKQHAPSKREPPERRQRPHHPLIHSFAPDISRIAHPLTNSM